MKKIYFYLLLLVCSCGFDPPPGPVETLYPLPYLPVYPGSWWRYLDRDNDTVVYRTENEYKEHSYKSDKLNGSYTNPVKVPYWNGIPVYGYSTPAAVYVQHCPNDPCGLSQVGFLSETTGDRFTVYSYQGTIAREVGNIDTSIVVNGQLYHHVIRVNELSASQTYHHPTTLDRIAYYAKDIGLIRKDNVLDSTISLQLIDCFINK